MSIKTLKRLILPVTLVATLAAAPQAQAEKKYGPGASDSEIRIGQTMPYSGPASAYGTIGKIEAAYFDRVNQRGGINGRKITLISLDDGYNPAKTVERTRRLVERDGVLVMYQTLGTPTSTAIRKYLNAKAVPMLFVASGAAKFADPDNFRWTMGLQPNYQTEARIYAKYILRTRPDAKIGVLYQNDDFGKDYLQGLKDGLGDKASSLIVAQASYEVTDATVDSQIVSLQAAGADTFVNVTTPKFAAQAIRKAFDIGWRPLQFLANVSISVSSVLTPAGLEKSEGLITTAYLKEASDPQWANDSAMKEYLAFMRDHFPEGAVSDALNVYGYVAAQALEHVLTRCGDDLTRENLMRQAANLKDVEIPLLLPGVRLNTAADDYAPIEAMRLSRFDGKSWVLFGDLIEN